MLSRLIGLAILVAIGYYSYMDKRIARSTNNVLLLLVLSVMAGVLVIDIMDLSLKSAGLLSILGRGHKRGPNVKVTPVSPYKKEKMRFY